ncbi:MAG: response regulator transcription factor [Solirubrobacteraceae bacterium]|jgi:DNA-binding response OmpR family regulator
MPDVDDHAETIRVDDLEITPDEGLVRAGSAVLTLSVREFQLLVAMVRHAGGIISREELCRTVWGRELRAGDRSVDVYVSKLRAKLEQAVPGRRYIHTHPSFGYRFQPEQAISPEPGAAEVRASAAAGGPSRPERTASEIVR